MRIRIPLPGRIIRKNEDGTTAVEFAILAFPLFLLILGILDVSLLLLGNYQLDNAVADVARQIRTGQVQTAGMTLDQFKASICNRLIVFKGTCTERLFVEVKTFPDYASIQFADPVKEETVTVTNSDGTTTTETRKVFDESIEGDFTTGVGTAGSIVGIRVFYLWEMLVPFVANLLKQDTVNDGLVLLSTAAAFRNEPFK